MLNVSLWDACPSPALRSINLITRILIGSWMYPSWAVSPAINTIHGRHRLIQTPLPLGTDRAFSTSLSHKFAHCPVCIYTNKTIMTQTVESKSRQIICICFWEHAKAKQFDMSWLRKWKSKQAVQHHRHLLSHQSQFHHCAT